MSGDARASDADRIETLEQELRLARRELKWVRVDQEHLTEGIQRVRRQRAKLREQSASLATALAAQLSAAYWRDREAISSRLRRRDPEVDLVREIEAHPLFDAGWYLRQNQAAILEANIPPALHHLRHANQRRLDPGEDFSTGRYLIRHPELVDADLPALLHAERNGLMDDGLLPGSGDARAVSSRET